MSTEGCDFSVRHYEEILTTALESGYRFVGYQEIGAVPVGERACILRHDIDYMPEWAERFGKVEAALGITAAYFFQVCAKPYNLRESRNTAIVRQLANWGHVLGLHFDTSWNPDVEWKQLASLCKEDKTLFEMMTGVKPDEVVTIHNPHRFQDRILGQPIPDIRHAYEKEWFSDIKYLSDSKGWYEGCMCGIFREKRYERIQLLIHPYLWPEDGDEDFVGNLARMVRWRIDDLIRYMVKFHPVCAKNETCIRDLAGYPSN